MKTIAIFAAVVVATAATAQPVSTQVRVSYADLNLASAAGQAALARRIDAAAGKVCAVDPNQRDFAMKANSDRCFTAAVSRANLAVASADTLVLASR
jgi:UrcA family protein